MITYFYSDYFNSTDPDWHLDRISGDMCMDTVYEPNFSQFPKPFKSKCYTTIEVIMVIITILGRADIESVFFEYTLYNIAYI